MQHQERGTCNGSESFRVKTKLYGKAYNWFLCPGQREARPGPQRPARRRTAAAGLSTEQSTGQNTILPAHSGLRSLFNLKMEEQVLSGSTAPGPGPGGQLIECSAVYTLRCIFMDRTTSRDNKRFVSHGFCHCARPSLLCSGTRRFVFVICFGNES